MSTRSAEFQSAASPVSPISNRLTLPIDKAPAREKFRIRNQHHKSRNNLDKNDSFKLADYRILDPRQAVLAGWN
jgi:hypothetical protein